MKSRRAIGDKAKFIKADNSLRVGGYLVRFTNADDPDLHGEYFDRDTNFWLDEHPVKGLPIFVDHMFDAKMGAIPVGVLDFVKEDSDGLWVEGKLKESDEYVEMLSKWNAKGYINISKADILKIATNLHSAVKMFFDTGKVHWSSGALPQSVEVSDVEGSKSQHIDSWMLIEGTGVMSPAEPDGTEIRAVKSALEQLQDLVNIQSDKSRIDAEKLHRDVNADDSNETNTTDNNEETKMNEDEIRAIIRMVLEENANAKAEGEEDLDEEDALASVTAEAKAEEDDEAEKAEDMDDDEKAKHYAEYYVAKTYAYIEAKKAAREKVMSAARKASQTAQRRIARNQKADTSHLGGFSTDDPNKGTSRIQMGDNLKTAHLSASDMALAVMMRQAPAKAQGIPVPLANYFDEPFFKEMAHKMHKYADTNPYTNTSRAKANGYHMDLGNRENYNLKASIPFKADELNAAVITGQGAEWVAEWWSTDLWERERYETHYDSMVSKGMQVQVLPQGVDQAHFSTEGADPIAYVAGEARSVDATGRPETTLNINPFATGTVSVTPTEIKIATSTTTILEEDSIINVVANVNRQISNKALETRDQLMVNGDVVTGTTNMNSDGTAPATGLSTPYYIASDGFRVVGLANGRDANNVLNLAQYRLTLQQLDGELRQFYERMVFFIDPTTEMASLAITEIATDDVRRTNATVTSGRLLNVHGVDVRVNGWIPQTDADGKVTGTGNAVNRGSILLAYAPYWGAAWKRQMTMETARDIYSGSNIYVMSMRLGFIERGTNAAALTYNVATTAS